MASNVPLRTRRPRTIVAKASGFFAVAALVLAIFPADLQAQSWPEVKCARYRAAWKRAVARRGLDGIGPAFIARHDAFLASGCTADADVCPHSPEEIELADELTVRAMSAGMASTFLPFACRK